MKQFALFSRKSNCSQFVPKSQWNIPSLIQALFHLHYRGHFSQNSVEIFIILFSSFLFVLLLFPDSKQPANICQVNVWWSTLEFHFNGQFTDIIYSAKFTVAPPAPAHAQLAAQQAEQYAKNYVPSKLFAWGARPQAKTKHDVNIVFYHFSGETGGDGFDDGQYDPRYNDPNFEGMYIYVNQFNTHTISIQCI